MPEGLYVQFIKDDQPGGRVERWADGSETIYCNKDKCRFGTLTQVDRDDPDSEMSKCGTKPSLRFNKDGTFCETYEAKDE